jgi:hypothetical protein
MRENLFLFIFLNFFLANLQQQNVCLYPSFHFSEVVTNSGSKSALSNTEATDNDNAQAVASGSNKTQE